jgi:uncharacterized membrane protein YphA (DoxX/SURF4 family)
MIGSIIRRFPWLYNTDTGLLVLRIGVSIIFIFAGWMKYKDMTGTVGFFASIGFKAFWAYLVTAVELLGGIAVLLGVCTRVAAKLLAIVMVVAIYVVHGNPQMLMTPVLMLFATVALVLAGGGKYSLKSE